MEEHLEHNDLISKWLNGDLSPDEHKKLDESEELNDLKIVMEDINTWSLRKYDVEQGLSKLKKKQNVSSTKIIQWGSLWKVAAVITLVVGVYFGWNNLMDDGLVELATGIGETKEIKLPGGSIIEMDATSTVSYNKKIWNQNRAVALSGQAFFDIKKGSTFIVNTNQGTVEVLGTKFNIEVAEEEFLVKCYEGSVKVQSNHEEQVLNAGESARLKKRKLIPGNHNETIPDWKEGFSEYNQEPLNKVVNDLKKRYSVEISLPDRYRDLKFSGKITHDNLESALRSIFVPMEISYALKEDGKVVFD